MNRKSVICSVVGMVAMIFSVHSAADDSKNLVVFKESEKPTADSIVNAILESGGAQETPKSLLPKETEKETVKYRGVFQHDPSDVEVSAVEYNAREEIKHGLQGEPETGCAVSNSGISVYIHFALDSYGIKPEGYQTLGEVAAALNSSKLKACRFSIEGHTDSKGNEGYNLALSKKRAEAVSSFLVYNNISRDRMTVEGKGESEPLIPENPKSTENRRVEFIISPAN